MSKKRDSTAEETIPVESSLNAVQFQPKDDESAVDLKTLSTVSYVSWRGFQPPSRITGWVNVVFIIMADLIGTGIVGLPETFTRMGWAIGLLILISFGLLTAYSGLLLWRLHMTYDSGVTFGNLAHSVSGRVMMWVTWVIVYSHFFLKMANYLLAAAKAIQSALWMYKICLYYATVASLAFLLPLCQIRTLHEISYAGLFSVLMISTTIMLLLIRAYSTWGDRESEGVTYNALPLESGPRGFLSAFSAMGSLVFAYGGQGMYLETMSEMKNPKDFPKALSVFMTLIILIYVWSSTSLYFRYGDTSYGYVIFNMGNNAMQTAASTCMVLHVFVSFCLNSQLLTRAIQVRLFPSNVSANNKKEALQWLCISTCTVLSSWLVSNAIPFFSDMEAIISSLCVGPTTFGFPALFYLLACRRNGKVVPLWERALCYCMILIAIFFVTVGTGVDIYTIIENAGTYGRPFTCIVGSISS
ncbi:transmembrane amino acid transporter [Chloropicon primus]|uniref:Transmembrane amino acid transporter n=1 Tax=Chloropicon primus TaxID=1764295 RepID=A0A5B8MC13_9CHLO|nr:transmembrane amino acid transporter [Chloropicon primus]UPQ96840.1 transmembrane amino acid transporter [Chloropicon primus]|mmetsp:Transcript_12076/g.33450  ORF Transcript_12076/g.33450 Transcript_12076/m.33450 type:complete len:471 (+) Transcript_12076:152-1564(+)|eukprot:QDZ17624.1 transmembrane amino acid transporter [Chloropicon primus]